MSKILAEEAVVIIPCYNEAAVISTVLHELISCKFNVVVVDDCSNDETGFIAKKFPIHYIKHPINLGQGAALATGFQYAQSLAHPYVVTFDADGQHQVDDIFNLLHELTIRECDVVFGSRFLGSTVGMPILRKLILKLAIQLNYLFTGIRLSDAHNGLRAIKKASLHHLIFSENRMAHATEILNITKKQNLKYSECGMTIRYTDYSLRKGQKNISSVRLFLDICLHQLF
jgi:glycosyltransferase involved in cell wall biosynthesis